MSFKSPEQCIGEESELFILSRTYFWEIYRGYPQTVQQKIYLPCIRDLEKYLHYEFSSEEKRIVVNLPIKFKSIIKHIDLSSVNNLCLGGGLNVFQDYLTLDIIEGCQYHHDLTKKLPFDNESIENISLSHVLEYFERKLAASIMGDCFRVLKPGGVVRIAVPDFDIFIDAYVKKDRDFLEQKVKVNGRSVDRWPGASLSDRVMHLAYGCNGHKDFYSYESLKSILQDAGFSDIRRCSFREGRLLNTEVIDNRPEHSLYVEACK
jgi:predicted SAM-dependent methyltransferase